MIPFLSFDQMVDEIRKESHQVLDEFFDSKHFVLGPQTEMFETEYAKFNEVTYCLGVSNGLDALILALRTCNIGPNDEVIVPSNTYIASILAIVHVGATPVLVEPRETTCNLNPEKLHELITPKTKAIMPVHLYGQPCEMEAIMSIADKHNLFVIEDNAQAHGALLNNKMCGSFGHINATSFYPTKNIGAFGEAGAVTTMDPVLYEKAKSLRNYGSEVRYKNKYLGNNWRIDELQAGFLRLKLKHYKNWLSERRRLATIYQDYLSNISQISLPFCIPNAQHVFHLFVIKADDRDALQAYLLENEIQTIIHYPIPPHKQEGFMGWDISLMNFPIAEKLAKQCLSLPLFPGLKDDQIMYICSKISSFYNGKD
jgi:dTDP-4-amino-4,6-dideoxygalactose transaminase